MRLTCLITSQFDTAPKRHTFATNAVAFDYQSVRHCSKTNPATLDLDY